jgi:Holliday junction resolvase RusA-like endonuclease
METKMISLKLYGDPVPQKRPRFARRGNFVHTYDEQAKMKEGYKWQLKSQYREDLLSVPLLVDITFFMPIPESTSKARKTEMIRGKYYHMKRPDLDNLEKFLLDCLIGTVIEDDSIIVEVRKRKIYCSKSGTELMIIPVAEQIKEVAYEDIARSAR